MNYIAIIGSGSFGCAVANTLSINKKVKIWSFKEEEKEIINNKHECPFIKDTKLNKNIICFNDYEKVIKDSKYIFLVTPSNVIRKTCIEISKYITNQKIIVCSKGLENDTNKLLTQIVKEEIPNNLVGILSGPSIANEILDNKYTRVVFSSENEDFNNEIRDLFKSSYINVETSTDTIGVEIGGSLKNIAALSVGMIKGLNLGENLKSVIMTKILEEICIIGISLGAQKETFYGLSGLGDLIVTCSSENSRNNRAGVLLGQGKSIEETKEEIGMVIEGLDALNVAYSLSSKLDIKLIKIIYKIIYEKYDIQNLVDVLTK